MRRQLLPALRALLVFTVLTGLVYPLVMTGIAQALFREKANGSIVKDAGGKAVGSSLLGQSFAGPAYFHPRPSAAGDGYDPLSSSASNLGPSNPDLLDAVAKREAAYRADNDVPPGVRVPVDAVTASGSGLDPDISLANAELQAPRVAAARHLALADVLKVVRAHDNEGVNVLETNLALDRLGR